MLLQVYSRLQTLFVKVCLDTFNVWCTLGRDIYDACTQTHGVPAVPSGLKPYCYLIKELVHTQAVKLPGVPESPVSAAAVRTDCMDGSVILRTPLFQVLAKC